MYFISNTKIECYLFKQKKCIVAIKKQNIICGLCETVTDFLRCSHKHKQEENTFWFKVSLIEVWNKSTVTISIFTGEKE